ncbi:MAG: hypothetical protein ACRC1K_04070, partial [Planctomycetia bacterium]
LAAAFVFGMVHAIKPGHGKTMVAAYLVGERGTVGHALLLGAVTAATHTGTVLFAALMLRPFAAAGWLSQETLAFWLTLASGVMVAALGATLFYRRWTGKEDLLHVHGEGGHVHLPNGEVQWQDGRDHSQPHGHTHGAPSFAAVAALGFSAGLLPCDDAVLLLLAAVGAGLVTQAVYILLAFSAGLAAVLVLLGILVVKVQGFALPNKEGTSTIARRVQLVSSALVTAVGVALCVGVLV